MLANPFFHNKGPLKLKDIIKETGLNFELDTNILDKEIFDIKNLSDANNNDITFFHSLNYKNSAKMTKALACITKNEFTK